MWWNDGGKAEKLRQELTNSTVVCLSSTTERGKVPQQKSQYGLLFSLVFIE